MEERRSCESWGGNPPRKKQVNRKSTHCGVKGVKEAQQDVRGSKVNVKEERL